MDETISDHGRLAHLNQMYCKVYPGLRYITFVNGRPRAAIVNEMEAVLGLPASPQALPDDFATASPSIDSNEVERKVKSQDSQNWKAECERGLADVWRIAKARLKGLNLE
jgi:2-oxo-4-hydroxy-4-carboxy--5-ureidoimidazoline (OHCU) decarboxylase